MSQDFNSTLNLPKTDFPMRAGLPKREPEMLKKWEEQDIYNEMLKKNAQNTVAQSKQIAAMASGSSIKVETLQETWTTIVNGIDEVQKIQSDAREKRKQDAVALEEIKADYKKRMKA